MNLTLIASLSTLCLFVSMLVFFELGRRRGLAQLKRDPEGLAKGTSAAEGAVFGLLGLILALLVRAILVNSAGMKLEIETAYVILAGLGGMISGLVGALYPALRAASLDPIEALSYE